jgi:hypothetical protein
MFIKLVTVFANRAHLVAFLPFVAPGYAPVPAIILVYRDSFLAPFNLVSRHCASASKYNPVPR